MALLTSNANFVPTNKAELGIMRLQAAQLLGLHGLRKVVTAAQADGVELVAIRSIHTADFKGMSAREAARFGDVVMALHQSPRGLAHERPSPGLGIARDRINPDSKSASMKRSLVAVALPDGEQSLDDLSKIASRLKKDLTCVIYPDATGRAHIDRQHARRFPAGAFIQPTPDVLACWNIHPAKTANPQALVEELNNRELGIAWGTFHAGRKGKVVDYRIGEEAEDAEKQQSLYLQGLLDEDKVGEIHIELARTDFMDLDPEHCNTSIQEAQALITGKGLDELPLGRRLEQLRDALWVGNVVVEATVGGIAETLKRQGLKPTRQNIMKAHVDINGHLREALPSLRTTART